MTMAQLVAMEEMLEALKATVGYLDGRIKERVLSAIEIGERFLSLLEDA